MKLFQNRSDKIIASFSWFYRFSLERNEQNKKLKLEQTLTNDTNDDLSDFKRVTKMFHYFLNDFLQSFRQIGAVNDKSENVRDAETAFLRSEPEIKLECNEWSETKILRYDCDFLWRQLQDIVK